MFETRRYRRTGVHRTLAWAAFLVGVIAAANTVAEERADAESAESAEPETGHGMPIASVRSSYYGFAALVDPMPETFEEELEASMLFTSVDAVVPIPFADRAIVLLPGVFFEHTHLEYRGWDFDVTPPNEQQTDFYATGIEITVLNELSERVWFATRLTWGLYSDLKQIDENDARLYGVAMADVLIAKDTVLGLGLSYNSDLGFPTPLPFLHFGYQTSWFRTDITIPSSAEAFFLPSERVELGARARLLGNEYRMTYEDDEWDNLLVQISTLEVGGVGSVRLIRGIWLEIGGGTTLNNRYKGILPDGSVLREIHFAPTWFANAALTYRL